MMDSVVESNPVDRVAEHNGLPTALCRTVSREPDDRFQTLRVARSVSEGRVEEPWTEVEIAGHKVKVSACDVALIREPGWYISQGRWGGYVVRKRRKATYFHRLVAGATTEEVDHVNRDKLDNRRSNLRLVTHRENLQNTGSRSGSTSRHKGVYRQSNNKAWTVQIVDLGQVRTISGIADETIAGAIWDLLAIDRFGPNTRKNHDVDYVGMLHLR